MVPLFLSSVHQNHIGRRMRKPVLRREVGVERLPVAPCRCLQDDAARAFELRVIEEADHPLDLTPRERSWKRV